MKKLFKFLLILLAVILAVAAFNISIQVFMPYLILYYTVSLEMDNYVLIMAPAIVLAAVFTAARQAYSQTRSLHWFPSESFSLQALVMTLLPVSYLYTWAHIPASM